VRVSYSVEEALCGDAGGVKRCEAFFRDTSDPNEPFLVIGGDDLTDTDIGHVLAFHRDHGATATLAVTPVEDPSEYGVVVVNESGRVTRFQEKPKPDETFSNLANTGIYVFQPKVFDYIPPDTFFGFGNNVFPALMAGGETVAAVASEAYWKDVGNLAIYRQAQRDCMDHKCQVAFPAPELRSRIWMTPDDFDLLEERVFLAPPVVIGRGCRIEPGATVGDYSVLGDGCVIEADAEVRNCVLWPGAVIKAGTYLENCVVGAGVEVASSHGIFHGLIVDPQRAA
jgi:NDP-sugar pyrophosphorylase family protein